MEVNVWNEIVTIPTYEIGEPEKNPIFLEKRVYQGSSGSVYPYPVIEKISDERVDKEWNAVFLENKYLKIMILPELGGRVQMAYDKIKQRHFVYYNHVIKPALVGLTGPWISGGIEFNWPQHHRPSTYQPVDFSIEENPDGSKTVWCSEVERMFRTKGMAGFTLYPDTAYMEIKVRLYNRTAQPQTFLWWANPAVKVNDHYQSVFPPDVNAVFDHGKRDVSHFPIATGTYYKVDYSAGVDISRYKNIPVPTSYMAINSKYNFVGGYENDTKGGLLHVANHYISPGKKQWTWGNGDFGQAWDRNLTDEDGPYIELMCGVYTDNQPDFSWLMPYEEKRFNQYFMPYRDLGVVKNATKEAMVNLEITNEDIAVKLYTTGNYPEAKVLLLYQGDTIFEDIVDFSPEMSYNKTIPVPPDLKIEDLDFTLSSNQGRLLVSYHPAKEEIRPIPDAAKAAKEPHEINTIEELYLTGLHLEQYRHATYNPADYYLEALRRVPEDVRANNAMGLWLLRKGCFKEAEAYFRRAIKTLTKFNPNPYDGEPFFNLGICLKFQYRYEEAYEAFYKSIWNAAWQDAGYFNLAQLASMKQEWNEAYDLISDSLSHNWHNHKARHLKTVMLRKLGRKDDALRLIEESLALDGFNFGVLYEKYLLTDNPSILSEMKKRMRNDVHHYIEFSLDYAHMGLFHEASQLIEMTIPLTGNVYPMVYYFLGWYTYQAGKEEEAIHYFVQGSMMSSDYCFPNRLEEVLALQCASGLNSSDAKAPYYLGNFWYAARQYDEAVKCWEASVRLKDSFPIVHRNLSLAYYNKKDKPQAAVAELEKAFSLSRSDARILMELDQLYKKIGKSFAERLAFLEKYPSIVDLRDDLYLERVTLYNMTGKFKKALDLLMNRHFHPWEGGEGKVVGQYLYAHIELAKEAMGEDSYDLALDHLIATDSYPYNLGEGKLYGTQENDINYWKGCVYEKMGDSGNAVLFWEKASTGLSEPSAAMFYNDQQPDKIFYQGLALLRLNSVDEAYSRFNKLKDYGEKHIFDGVKIDYFAVSLPDLLIWEDDLQKRNRVHCLYLLGLGYLGLGDKENARRFLSEALTIAPNHIGSLVHLKMCD
ncbi:DUF5107 domain-containing protein [Microbacter margulisiae]|uniref:Tetratricopeptide (TPR) repeat protein n=1 Tax=Microbacter margulisiae TaxID=1350067 RepID=A0A7W5DQT4_9PORP|nr:DUF5107 domain-containing protein [Microbacter margulisiae]MBB3187372.1 tetratricopeptide (TPR) repeat protein [Microbacter margulisiae]